ncbi:hypothetical protein ACFQZ8_06625, partial [Micromonospora azadirachtae]
MSQANRMHEHDPETRKGERSVRGGFVDAFVYSVRRGQLASVTGKVAVSVLVLVLAAASVVGLSVLMRGADNSAEAASAASAAASPAGP